MATIELVDRTFQVVSLPGGVTITPRRWSARMPGGPDKATVDLTGPKEALWQVLQWLRYGVQIRNDFGALVWWGYVHEASVSINGVRMGLSLEGMHNRVNVLYSYTDTDDAPQTAETGWAEAAPFVDAYGAKEIRYSAGDTTADEAVALLYRILYNERKPVATARDGDGDGVSASIECRGWWHTLNWQYYNDATGRIVADDEDAEQTLGWVLTSAAIAFTRLKQISHNGNALSALREGDALRVTGSTSNNITYFVKRATDGDETESYTGTTVWFDAADDIMDTAEQGLGFVKTNDVILVAGSVNNSGYHVIDGAQASHLVTDTGYGGAIVGESLGPSITVTRCLTAEMDTTGIAREMPGATVTLTMYGQWMAVKWTPSSGTWPALEVMLKLKKIGGPSDAVRISIYSDTAGLPGTLLGYTDLAAADIGTTMSWRSVILSAAISVTAATYYWVTAVRTGAANADNYYSFAVDESFTAPSNALKLYDGVAWQERTPNADGCFQVWGRRDNSLQMASMGAAATLIARTDIQATTGLVTRHYRDGTQTIQDELVKLLDSGTAAGGGLVGYVNPLRTLIVQAESVAENETDLILGANGIALPSGKRLDAGQVPAGAWARVAEMPHTDSLSSLSPMYLEFVEWDEKQQRWTWEPRGLPNVAAIWTLRNG